MPLTTPPPGSHRSTKEADNVPWLHGSLGSWDLHCLRSQRHVQLIWRNRLNPNYHHGQWSSSPASSSTSPSSHLDRWCEWRRHSLIVSLAFQLSSELLSSNWDRKLAAPCPRPAKRSFTFTFLEHLGPYWSDFHFWEFLSLAFKSSVPHASNHYLIIKALSS